VDPQKKAELDEAMKDLDELIRELVADEESRIDAEVRERMRFSGWLGLADSICHDPFRRRTR
jgi:hypothetical protein